MYDAAFVLKINFPSYSFNLFCYSPSISFDVGNEKKRIDISKPIIGTDAEKSIKLMMIKQFVQPEAVVKVRSILKKESFIILQLSSYLQMENYLEKLKTFKFGSSLTL